MDLLDTYRDLLGRFGPQEWWPMCRGFDPPEWEVCVGAILTQNTNWRNVEKALLKLKGCGILSPSDMMTADVKRLEEAVRPSGFYRQKAGRLKALAGFVLGFGSFGDFMKDVTREQLLGLKGIGPETADSILLYALGRPHFVVDAYTRRMFPALDPDGRKGYGEWKRFFESNLPRDVALYKEFHALIVAAGKADGKKRVPRAPISRL